jgi:hypothetical protein
MLLAMVACTILVLATVVFHYEALRVTSDLLPRLTMPPRQRMLVVLIAVFAFHTVEVWLYALGYYLVDRLIDVGSFGGEIPTAMHDYVYFSAVSYTSLGFGDVYPLRGLRLVAGVEALNGLLLIGWSASFTFLAIQEFWGLHRELLAARRKRRGH